MSAKDLSRRDFLKATAVAGAGALLARCAPQATPTAVSPTQAPIEAPSQPHAGKTITVGTLDGELSNGLEDQKSAFEEATGIQLEIAKIPGSDMRAKISADLASGAGVYDVILQPFVWEHEWQQAGYFIPLDDFIAADPTVDIGDFIPTILEAYGKWDGKQYTLPYQPICWIFFYRKDLFGDQKMKDAFNAKTGKELVVPQTTDEYYEAARFFTKKLNPDSPTDYGFAFMGQKNVSWWWWAIRLAVFGGDYFDENFHPKFNNDAGKQALELCVRMLETAPEDVAEYDWTKNNTAFLSGKVAMTEQWPGLGTMVETPEGDWGKSLVVGKVGSGIPPGAIVNGTLVQRSVLSGWAGAISKFSKEQEAAYATIAWLTGKQGEPLKIKAGNAPCRKSTYETIELTPEMAHYPALMKSLEVAKILADVDAAPVSQQLQDYMGTTINRVLIGELEIDEALDQMDKEWTKILKDAGLYK